MTKTYASQDFLMGNIEKDVELARLRSSVIVLNARVHKKMHRSDVEDIEESLQDVLEWWRSVRNKICNKE